MRQRAIAIKVIFQYIMSVSDEGFQIALAEAKKGASEGGVPIGACLVDRRGKVLGRGHNMRVQKGSAILHVRRQSFTYALSTRFFLHSLV